MFRFKKGRGNKDHLKAEITYLTLKPSALLQERTEGSRDHHYGEDNTDHRKREGRRVSTAKLNWTAMSAAEIKRKGKQKL